MVSNLQTLCLPKTNVSYLSRSSTQDTHDIVEVELCIIYQLLDLTEDIFSHFCVFSCLLVILSAYVFILYIPVGQPWGISHIHCHMLTRELQYT